MDFFKSSSTLTTLVPVKEESTLMTDHPRVALSTFVRARNLRLSTRWSAMKFIPALFRRVGPWSLGRDRLEGRYSKIADFEPAEIQEYILQQWESMV